MDVSVEFGIPVVFFSKEHNQFFKLSRVQSRHEKSKEKHTSPSLSKSVWQNGRFVERACSTPPRERRGRRAALRAR
jgi:hypothetical protein